MPRDSAAADRPASYLVGTAAAFPLFFRDRTKPINQLPFSPSAKFPKSGSSCESRANQNDRLFVYEATIGGKAEVEFGQLAEQKGRAQAVKDFSRQMVTDHGKANQQLMQLAQAANIPQPGQLDEEHKAMRAQLDKLGGAEFDLAYIRGQV